MTKRNPRSKPTWTDVKAKLAGVEREGLTGLIHDLYAAHKDNQTFLHTRFGLGEDVLEPYKETLDRWLWPDALRNQNTSVANAKKAISSYRKAVGEPAGLADLMTFFANVLLASPTISATRMKATFMLWSVCSSRLSRSLVSYSQATATP
jgi:hypothetical protein